MSEATREQRIQRADQLDERMRQLSLRQLQFVVNWLCTTESELDQLEQALDSADKFAGGDEISVPWRTA